MHPASSCPMSASAWMARSPVETRTLSLLIEVDRTARGSYNSEKFVAYDHFLAGWCMKTRRYGRELRARPIVVFVAQSPKAALSLLARADEDMTVGVGLPGHERSAFVFHGRSHTAFTCMTWLLGGCAYALRMPATPPSLRGRDTPLEAEAVALLPEAWWPKRPTSAARPDPASPGASRRPRAPVLAPSAQAGEDIADALAGPRGRRTLRPATTPVRPRRRPGATVALTFDGCAAQPRDLTATGRRRAEMSRLGPVFHGLRAAVTAAGSVHISAPPCRNLSRGLRRLTACPFQLAAPADRRVGRGARASTEGAGRVDASADRSATGGRRGGCATACRRPCRTTIDTRSRS